MIIKLKKYNEVRELLKGMAATGSHGHICYQDGVQRIYLTTWLSTWGEGDGDVNRTQDTYNWPPIQE